MRRASQQQLAAIWNTVEKHPGICPAKVAYTLGISRSSVTRALPAMNERGLLLSEDSKGGLWPWKRVNKS